MTKISEQDAYQYFRNVGYSDVAAAGIVGGLQTESGLNTGSFNPNDPSGGSHGIAQWNGSRWLALQSYAARRGIDPNSADAQLGFVDFELNTNPGSTGNALQYLNSATDAKSATSAFLRYERPAGYTSADPTTANSYASRLANTQDVLGGKYWTGGGSLPGGGTDLGTIHAGSPPSNSSSPLDGPDGSIAHAIGTKLSGAVEDAAAKSTASITGTATGIATSWFNSLKDYFGRAIFIILGILLIGVAAYVLLTRTNVDVALKSPA